MAKHEEFKAINIKDIKNLIESSSSCKEVEKPKEKKKVKKSITTKPKRVKKVTYTKYISAQNDAIKYINALCKNEGIIPISDREKLTSAMEIIKRYKAQIRKEEDSLRSDY